MAGPIKRNQGILKHDVCSTHYQVEWTFDYRPGNVETYGQRSEEFTFEQQTFFIYVPYFGLYSLLLNRKGPAFENPITCWAGVKYDDGSYDYQVERFTIKATTKNTISYHKRPMITCLEGYGKLTVFLRMSKNLAEVVQGQCIHEIMPENRCTQGKLEERSCEYHTHFEWKVKLEKTSFKYFKLLTSPVLRIKNQSLVMKYCYQTFSLYRIGFSPNFDSKNMKLWIGLKLGDNTFEPFNFNLTFDMECELWRLIHDFSISEHEISKYISEEEEEECLTVFIWIHEPKSNTLGLKDCIRNTASLTRGRGKIRELCSSPKLVQWKVQVEEVHGEWMVDYASPILEVEDQYYSLYLEVDKIKCNGMTTIRLFLLRLGASVSNRKVYCWAKMTRDNTFYPHKKDIKAVSLEEICPFWTKTNKLLSSELTNTEKEQLLASENNFITIVFCINDTRSADEDPCSYDNLLPWRPPPGMGNMLENDSGNFKSITWEVYLKNQILESKRMLSPVFSIGGQNYSLCLSCETIMTGRLIVVSLFRQGPAVDGPNGLVRCCLGLGRSSEHQYQHFGATTAALSLTIPCVMWTEVISLWQGKIEKEEVTVSFLIGPKNEFRVKVYRTRRPCPRDFEVVFGVRKVYFVINKIILQLRLQVFHVMLLQRNKDLTSEIIQVIDCDPRIFGLFLNYVVNGTLKNVKHDNMFGLYVVADKYLSDDLTKECKKLIRKKLGEDGRNLLLSAFRTYPANTLIKRLKYIFRLKKTNDSANWLRFINSNPASAISLISEL